ncbi:hypothetical protein INR49_000560 [Caranx melampygus]|nr:hypothetical protein INR49_000560 [Caranx melampygus]
MKRLKLRAGKNNYEKSPWKHLIHPLMHQYETKLTVSGFTETFFYFYYSFVLFTSISIRPSVVVLDSRTNMEGGAVYCMWPMLT